MGRMLATSYRTPRNVREVGRVLSQFFADCFDAAVSGGMNTNGSFDLTPDWSGPSTVVVAWDADALFAHQETARALEMEAAKLRESLAAAKARVTALESEVEQNRLARRLKR